LFRLLACFLSAPSKPLASEKPYSAKKLLECGANIYNRDSRLGNTVLHLLVIYRRKEMYETLYDLVFSLFLIFFIRFYSYNISENRVKKF